MSDGKPTLTELGAEPCKANIWCHSELASDPDSLTFVTTITLPKTGDL